MSINKVCRVCLSVKSRTIPIVNTQLQKIYEKLANIPFYSDVKPSVVCYICCAHLQRSYDLMLKCLKADQVFQELIKNVGEVMLTETVSFNTGLTVTKLDCINISPLSTEIIDAEIVKGSIGDVKKETYTEPKLEKVADNTDECFDRDEVNNISEDNRQESSDSDDDVPLMNIRTKARVVRSKERVRRRVKLNSDKGFSAEYAKEVILSKEEQIQEILERSKSLNYLNSPLKCELCFKGFVDARAYDNHKRKHDVQSGVHTCEVCRMRYASVRQLRTHVVTSHERRFQCARCPHRAHTANQAREHEKWHGGFKYECQLCSHKFSKPTSYLSHMRKSHPSAHACEICGDSFISRHGLRMHRSKTHVGDQPEKSTEPASERFCAECNIQFVSVDAWKRHMLSSAKHLLIDDKSLKCKICDLHFPYKVNLEKHLKEHARALNPHRPTAHAQPSVHCEQCGSRFINRSKMLAHVKRIHLGVKYNKNIVCEVCGKKCTSNASLKYHQRTHTGERPFQCLTCEKHFADKNQLRIHTRTHTGEKPYCCGACGKRFSQKPALNRHYRVHTGAKPYPCSFCGKSFSQSNSLKLHISTVHHKKPAARRPKQDGRPALVDSVADTAAQN